MSHPEPKAGEQIALWNGPAGRAWAELHAVLDGMLQPFLELLVDAVAKEPAQRVLDVGCGTGSTTIAIARRLGTASRCTGIDVSAPMIEGARARAERENVPVSFVLADAATHAFDPRSYDTIVSRFGVMFFDDPVRAFENIRKAATQGGRLHFVAWRSPAENAFMTTAERAAAPLLPELPARSPDAPGQFAFADRARVESILDASGWSSVAVEPVDLACSFAEKDLVPYLSRFGPIGRFLDEVDASRRARIIAAVRAAFDTYVHGDEVRFTAACWSVSARA